MKKIILTVVFIVVAGFALGSVTGCGDGSVCSDDQNCVLSGNKTYNHTCGNAAGCHYRCTDGATCHLSCPKGHCNVTGENATEVILDCSGDDCYLQCTNTATCEIRQCTSNCNLQCMAGQTCTNSCDESAGCSTADEGGGF